MANLYDEKERELDRPLRAAYYTHIRDRAISVVEEMDREQMRLQKGRHHSLISEDERATEWLSETLDQAASDLSIYTQDGMFAMWESDNRDAWQLIYSMSDFMSGEDDIPWSKLGYWAIRADLQEALEALGSTHEERMLHLRSVGKKYAMPTRAAVGRKKTK